jgi:hypothetical protein
MLFKVKVKMCPSGEHVQIYFFHAPCFFLAFLPLLCKAVRMEHPFKYRGKIYTAQDICSIQKLIDTNPDDSRWILSRKLCLSWNWIQANGALCDQVCRSFMLALDRAGHIKLPPPKTRPFNYLANRKKPLIIAVDHQPIRKTLGDIGPLEICEIRRGEHEKLCDSLIEQFHYLGYCHPVGEHLKYLIFSFNKPVACLTFSSAPRHIASRDRFIGWKKAEREKNLVYMAYNSRFLILPWVKVKYLASHILGIIARQISADWQKRYRHPVYYLETFVDKERFSGTCFRAANWIYLGDTTGRGKNDQTGKANRSIKAVYGYPLTADFRKKLCGQ